MRLIVTILVLCALLVGSLLLDRPREPAELTAGYISIETLDAQTARASEDIRVSYSLFEGLCTFDPYTFTVEPGVAASWEVSGDGLTYTFHLRDNARWSDGSPILAPDFVYTWRMGLMPDTAPPYLEFIQYLKGGKAFTNWCTQELAKVKALPVAERLPAAERRAEESKRVFEELVGVRAINDRTLEVKVERAMPYFLEMVASWPFFPLHPPTIREATKLNRDSLMLRRDPEWTQHPKTFVGNGPYVLEEVRFKRFIRLRANEHYRAADRVGPKTVELVSFNDLLTEFNGYETGVIDIMFDAQGLNFAPYMVADHRAGKRNDLIETDGFSTYYYCFNTRPRLPSGAANPFANPRVRRAFTLAVDRHAIVNEVTRLRQTVAGAFIPPGSIPGYRSPRGVGYNPELARKELAEAGYPGGRGLPPIELSYNSGAGHQDIAQAVARMWAGTLGVQVIQSAQEWKVYLSRRQAGDFMVCRHGWTGDYADPTTFLDLFRTGNGNNDAGYSNHAYDALLDRAAAEHDAAKRMAILTEAERFLLEEQAALCPIYYNKLIHLHREHVQGVNNHPRDLQFFHLMRVERRDPGLSDPR